MIYDCFTFFNELDLLEIRLNYLNKYVDKFVLVEMGKTHSGKDKPFYFEENISRYKDFLSKIIHIKVTDYPENSINNSWHLENYQRDCIMRGLKQADLNDIVMISDLDEIPSCDAIKSYTTGIMVLEQKMMYYFLNNLNVSDPVWVKGTKICHFSDLLNPNVELHNLYGCNYTKKGLPTYIRFCGGPRFHNGGWHFSYLGSAQNISYKITSFAHQELNHEIYTNTQEIERRVKSGQDLFDRPYVYKPIPIDDTFPEYIVQNQDKYKHLILSTD